MAAARKGKFSDDFTYYSNAIEHIDFPKGFEGEVKPAAALDAAIAAGKATEISDDTPTTKRDEGKGKA